MTSKKLSEHISVSEITCKDGCGACNIDQSVIQAAEMARTMMNLKQDNCELPIHFKGEVKLHISSGCRCPKRNKAEGGAKNSQHLCNMYNWTCRAIDGWFFYRDDYENNRLDATDVLLRMFKDGHIKGLGLYDKHRIHMDTRTGKKWFKDYRTGA